MKKELSTVTLATELYGVQNEIKSLEERETGIKSLLLEQLKKQGVRRVDMENGDMYIRVPKTTLSVAKGFEEVALKYAKKRYALKIDTGKIKDILKMEGKLDDLPLGFKRTDSEYLRVSKQGEETNDE